MSEARHAMANISPNLQHLTDELPATRRAQVEQAIASSPYLRQIMTEAVNARTFEHIRIGVPGANEGGHYDSGEKAIYLSPDTFSDPILKSRPERLLDVITSTLGHETGHALYTEKAEKERTYTTHAITEGIRAAGQDGEFDATGLLNGYIRSSRRDESLAEIHGWNALASRIEHVKGKPPGQEEMLERIDASTNCVDEIKGVRRLAPGIILDADMYMSDTRLPKAGPINLEPVAQCHFDNPRTSLGAGGAADYTNYYGAYLVQQLADDTRNWVNPPTIKLDMAKLGLDKAQLQSTGLRLGDQGFSLVDTSQGRYKPVVLHSSGRGIQGTPDNTEVALDEVRARALGDDAPRQVSPERTIAQATPEERDAREQAQREANRQGLSQEEVQQVVHAAAVGASARGMTREGSTARATGQELEDAPQAQREQVQAQTAAVTPEPEHTAAKIEPTTMPERQNETQTPMSADREPQEARTAATPAPATARDSDALRLGDRGDSVELLQYRLDRQGYRGPDGVQIPQTGQYGPETEHAVRQFQTTHGIPATGVAEQDTRDAVDRALTAQRERERGEPSGPNRSSPESTPARETLEPAIAPRTVGLSASGGRDAEDRNEREPQHAERAEAQPAALATNTPDSALAHRTATHDDRQALDKQTAAPLLDNPAHPNHGMYATLLKVVHERDHALGRKPDEHSKQLAGALTEQALAKGITTIGAAKFSDDGKVVGMTNTPNLSAEWAKTAAGHVGELADRPLAQSSEGAAKLNQQLEQTLALQAQTQAQTPPTQDDPTPKGPKL